MAKFVIIATAEITPGRREEAIDLFKAHGERCMREEPGTEQFRVLKPRNDDSVVMLYEVYCDEEAFKAHWHGPLVARIKLETEGILIKLTGTWCDLQDGSAAGASAAIPVEDLNASNDE